MGALSRQAVAEEAAGEARLGARRAVAAAEEVVPAHRPDEAAAVVAAEAAPGHRLKEEEEEEAAVAAEAEAEAEAKLQTALAQEAEEEERMLPPPLRASPPRLWLQQPASLPAPPRAPGGSASPDGTPGIGARTTAQVR